MPCVQAVFCPSIPTLYSWRIKTDVGVLKDPYIQFTIALGRVKSPHLSVPASYSYRTCNINTSIISLDIDIMELISLYLVYK
jgi:hypothetical protein